MEEDFRNKLLVFNQDSKGDSHKGKEIHKTEKVEGANACEKAFNALCKSLDKQTDAKFDHMHYEITEFSSMDNNLIDSVFSNLMTLSEEQKIAGVLSEEELIHHFCKMTKTLEHLYDLEFVKFWAYIIKFPLFVDFLDDYLLQIRKYNDFEKINIDLDSSLNESRLSSSGEEFSAKLKREVNRNLKVVFKIFFRLSQSMGSESNYFTVDFFKTTIYSNALFDVAKLLDISAIYGSSNGNQVQDLI